MPNILIVDQLEQTGILMKSLLSRYYGVSLSEDFSEAMRKIETALFDIVIIELERRNADVETFIKEAKELLPELPIIGLTAHEENLQELSAVNMIARPFRSAALMQAIQNGLSVYNTNPVSYHRAMTYTAEITQSEDKSLSPLKCSITDLSLKGMMVEPAFTFPARTQQENEKIQFQQFFKTLCANGRISSKPVRTNILIKEQEPIKIEARIAFVDNSSLSIFRRAGLSFRETDAQKNRILELMKTA